MAHWYILIYTYFRFIMKWVPVKKTFDSWITLIFWWSVRILYRKGTYIRYLQFYVYFSLRAYKPGFKSVIFSPTDLIGTDPLAWKCIRIQNIKGENLSTLLLIIGFLNSIKTGQYYKKTSFLEFDGFESLYVINTTYSINDLF